jgi:2',3'-cyclic-nucleotide 2'-phosphodiesterase (5'-nucleotidase family)
MTSFFKKTKSENKNVLIVDTGNFSPDYRYEKTVDAKTIANLMPKIGYDALNIGSHELDRGINHIKEITSASSIPLLNENVEFKNIQRTDIGVKDYIIKEFDGFKVGIIGFVGDGYATNYIGDSDFAILKPNEGERLTRLVQELNSEVDVIVILANSTFDRALKATESLSGANIVVIMGWGSAGRRDSFRRDGSMNSPLFFFIDSKNIGKLDLYIKNREISDYQHAVYKISDLEYQDDEVAQKTNYLAQKRRDYANKNIGTILNDIDAQRQTINNEPSNVISLIANPIKERWKDVDCVVINSGALYSYGNRVIKAGPMSMGTLADLYPFLNTVVISKLSGADIKSMLERSSSSSTFSKKNSQNIVRQLRAFLQSSGIEYTIDFSKDSQILSDDDKEIIREGERVYNITINKEPLDPAKYYVVATNDYVFGGGDGYIQFKNAKDVVRTGVEVQDLMADYIEKHSPVTLDPPDRRLFLNRKMQDFNSAVNPAN